MSEITRGDFDLGRVLQRLFATIGRNALVFFGLALMLTGLPSLLVGLATLQRAGSLSMGDFASPLAFLGGGLLGAITSFVLQAAIVHGAVMDLNGRKPTLVECLGGGLRHFLAVLAISILFSIAVVFGLLFLIVPGVIMLLVWAVAVPAQVVEDRGVFGAFSRSADLTRGHRLSILLLLVVWLIVAMVIGVLTSALAATLSLTLSDNVMLVQALVSPIGSSISAVISATGVAALYAELRQAKEGVEPDQLAAIFD